MILENWGVIEYDKALSKQEAIFDRSIQLKKDGSKHEDVLILCEHPSVYTLGKSGNATNMLLSEERLKDINASLYRTNRGGDITYHGPGQIVGYPIFDLEHFNIGLKDYIEKVEEVIIRTIADYGIVGERLDGATGVWLDADISGKQRKICAIGVHARKYITMHGFALNVNTNLQYFNYINPCGFLDKGVTSISQELGKRIKMQEVCDKIHHYFIEIFK